MTRHSTFPAVPPSDSNPGVISPSPCMTPGTYPSLVNEASARNDGWGSQEICPECHRGARYSCICDPFYADDDQTPAEDCTRIMESIKRINWLALGLDKPEGFERVEA